jgi:hypothetical protein
MTPARQDGARLARLAALLAGLDRRWIYLTLVVALALALLSGLTLPDRPSVLVRPIYRLLEELPARSPILISLDYTPSTQPELEPMALAIARHALLRDHRLVFISLWPEGNNQIGRVIDSLMASEFRDRREGVDYAVLGYKSGNEMVINALRQELVAMYDQDVRGRPLSELPVMSGLDRLDDFALLVAISAGTPGLKEWILFAGDPLGLPVAGGCNGAGAPQYLPYFPRQLLGLMAGIKGAAEYEAALAAGHPEHGLQHRPATRAMGPQAVGHAVIILFILLGNVGYLLARRQRRRSP